ncbi:DegT/DnrJ/EryC1/StrS family aminotransferase [soil metagenome]
MAEPQIPVFDVRVEQEDMDAVAATLRSGWLSGGPQTEAFEQEFAAHLGSKHVLALSSCTAALHLACIAAGIGPGDEVIVPSLTFVATANAVRYCGGRPIFADLVGVENDLNIDVEHVAQLINEKTKAVIPVHWAGYPVEIERLMEICNERGIVVIEDAAHAPWADFEGKALGTRGMAGCFSFFPNKVLGVGEGGALCTDSDEVADRIRRLRSQGMTATTIDRHRGNAMSYDVVELGFNYRFDDLRASLLRPRFARLGSEIERRRQIITRYRELLGSHPGIEIAYVGQDVSRSSCYLMGVMVDPAIRSAVRDRLGTEHAIQTTVYPATHELRSYVAEFGEVSLPRTEKAARSLFSIPLFPHLTDAQQDRVVAAVTESVNHLGGPA